MRSLMRKEWVRTTGQRFLHCVQRGGTEIEIGSPKRLSEYFSVSRLLTESVMRTESSPPLRTVIRKEWPPLQTCPQYKCGLINPIVDRKYPWEDEGKEDEWFNLYEPSVEVETRRKELLIARKFLNQVRTTRGYGVTFRRRSFAPVKHPERDLFVNETLRMALTHISKKTGKAYKLVKIENAVEAPLNGLMFLTFNAKMRDSVPETFLSMVSYRGGNKGVRECLLKPDCEADWGANEDKVLWWYPGRKKCTSDKTFY